MVVTGFDRRLHHRFLFFTWRLVRFLHHHQLLLLLLLLLLLFSLHLFRTNLRNVFVSNKSTKQVQCCSGLAEMISIAVNLRFA